MTDRLPDCSEKSGPQPTINATQREKRGAGQHKYKNNHGKEHNIIKATRWIERILPSSRKILLFWGCVCQRHIVVGGQAIGSGWLCCRHDINGSSDAFGV